MERCDGYVSVARVGYGVLGLLYRVLGAVMFVVAGAGAGCATPPTDDCRVLHICRSSPVGVPGAGVGGSGGSVGVGGGGGAGGISGAGGVGGVVTAGCMNVVDDCPQAVDPRCSTARCDDGVCGFEYKPFGELESQIRGDCETLYCDGIGNVIAVPDGSDTYNDGNQCTVDYCLPDPDSPDVSALVWKNDPLPEGTACPETGAGLCSQRKCVACTEQYPMLCGVGLICDFIRCVPAHCNNDVHDPNLGETDTDCGSKCGPCDTGKKCSVAGDCIHGVCAGACQPPSCSDGVKNDSETGIDCGGPPSCPRCPVDQGCDFPSDCESGVCWTGVCVAPTCFDGVHNGGETGIDCGVNPCPACPPPSQGN